MSGESVFYRVGKECGELVAEVIKALADKRVKLGEGLSIAKELAGLTMVIVSNFSQLKDGVRDGLDETESEELSEGFDEGLDLPCDMLEEDVQEYFALVMGVVENVTKLICKAAA